jgi:hypothetical protein
MNQACNKKELKLSSIGRSSTLAPDLRLNRLALDRALECSNRTSMELLPLPSSLTEVALATLLLEALLVHLVLEWVVVIWAVILAKRASVVDQILLDGINLLKSTIPMVQITRAPATQWEVEPWAVELEWEEECHPTIWVDSAPWAMWPKALPPQIILSSARPSP